MVCVCVFCLPADAEPSRHPPGPQCHLQHVPHHGKQASVNVPGEAPGAGGGQDQEEALDTRLALMRLGFSCCNGGLFFMTAHLLLLLVQSGCSHAVSELPFQPSWP